jgi:hypothetical protein
MKPKCKRNYNKRNIEARKADRSSKQRSVHGSKDGMCCGISISRGSDLKAIIAKPLKIPVSNRTRQCKNWFREIYADVCMGKKRIVRGGRWRFPIVYQTALMSTVSDLWAQEGIYFKHCMHDVLTRE